MISKKAYIINGYGIHCRPSAIIVKAARKHSAEITVVDEEGHEANAKNSLELISLALTQGQTVTIRVDGEDEEEVCERMVELFETDYDFER
ncbi:MAG: HPr family phosphocarrier protein [Lentisphaeria bacterium]